MIKDSGERREFTTGAVRDCSVGKGRFDIMPLDVIASVTAETVIVYINNKEYDKAIRYVTEQAFDSEYEMLLELSKHFENGLNKYGLDNWKKGIPPESYIDSAVRHWCKHKAGWKDEPHAVACIWNLVCLLWTIGQDRCKSCYWYADNPTSEWYGRCVQDRCEWRVKE